MSTYIKAPYNFVPLNKKVVIPYWSERVSHDIPFEDSESGSLQVTMTAHSPIFVCDGVKDQETSGNEKKVEGFNQFQGKYFIPGSSIKGMIRNVMEVMSFSGMANKVNDHRYAIRDLSPGAKDIYMNNFKRKEVSCGWLTKHDDESYTIEDCGQPGRISHRHLDEIFKTNFSTYFLERGGFDQRKDKQKAAQFKYQIFRNHNPQNKFKQEGESAGRKIFGVDSTGQSGTIVFTGQPGPRKKDKRGKWTGHHLEFIFFKPKENNVLTIEDKVIQNFLFAYYEHDKNRWSEDWKHWRKQLENGKSIPVFFRKGSRGEVLDLGLSFLYKLPYNNSIREAINKHQKEKGVDLSDAIFGYINNENSETEESLKGRVHIGHAWATHAETDGTKTVILSGPKASYFPNYIIQNIGRDGKVTNRYSTLMDDKPELAGWKRYPVHRNGIQSNLKPQDYETYKNVSTSFIPLKTDSIFEFTVRYHNLKKIELGALISSLTFHNTTNTFHSIGMAKPLGYGKISLALGGISESLKTECLRYFETFMDMEVANNTHRWHDSPQITNLITMVSEQDNQGSSELKYMEMGMKRGGNHFVEAKQRRTSEALDRYINLDGINKRIATSLVEESAAQNIKITIQNNKAKFINNRPITDQIAELKLQRSGEFYDIFEKRKEEFLQQIRQRRKAVAAEENLAKERMLQLGKEKEKERRNKEALNNPPIMPEDPTSKKAFKVLSNNMRKYIEDFYLKKLDELKEDFPDGGMLKEEYHDLIIDFVQRHIESRGNYDKKNWKKPFERNSDLRKLGEWIGNDKAKELLNKLV